MPMSTDSDKNQGQKLTGYIFECTMSIFYVFFAIIFLFTNLFTNVIYGNLRIALGVLLGVYGVFRVYRAVRKMVQQHRK